MSTFRRSPRLRSKGVALAVSLFVLAPLQVSVAERSRTELEERLTILELRVAELENQKDLIWS